MEPLLIESIITEIARRKLGVSSLVEQKRDALDFYELHVNAIRDALLVAFEAGRKAATDN